MKIQCLFGMLKNDFNKHFKMITPYHYKIVYKAKCQVPLFGQIDSDTYIELDAGKYYLLEVDYMLFNEYDDDYIMINSIETMSKREINLLRKLEIEQNEKN